MERKMPEPLAPQLNKIPVNYDRLVLDPNNPRFITRKEDQIAEEHFLEQDLAAITRGKLFPDDKDYYKIKELANSIKQNGWRPVDYIFVRKLKGHEKYYVVLEGNRRVTAIREIMRDPEITPQLKRSLQTIEVMEVLDSGSPEELHKKITYLLGVRHHGSLKKWTPFAQAHNIFIRYLEVAGQTPATFQWNPDFGQKVAATLSIQLDDVQNRLKVYRVMSQLGSSPIVKGHMEDRYYSICAEPLLSRSKRLGKYLNPHPSTFFLDDTGVSRMINLCHFEVPERAGAPLSNPQEWRYLDKLLADEDTEKREVNLKKVEVEKVPPRVVWAERAMELYKLTWEKWLFQVNSILKTVSLGDDFKTDKAKETASRLVELVKILDKRDLH
jgi:ParB-like nuclease domain